MELRMILFGYEKRRFKTFVNQAEAKTVKRIFNEYLSGKSLSAIADGLTKEQVVYFKDKTVWTKNAVKRILENPHYAGDSEYPAIISAEAFEKARDIRIKKHGGAREKDNDIIRYFKYHTVCAACGDRITRIRNYGKETKWICQSKCKILAHTDDNYIFSNAIRLVNRAILNPDIIAAEHTEKTYIPSPGAERSERLFSALLLRDGLQFDEAKKAVFNLAAERYNCCVTDNGGALTDALKEYLAALEPMTGIDTDILKTVISRFLIDENGIFYAEFVNGAVISNESEESCNANGNC